ncbi:MAG: aminomethyl-transferring glycine dehydrogenase subunit GcvPA [Gammaproteobacteria bacterium]|nr:MAG: aminomethyl-transferring glycine dehydrogenase subunit GcvPA [Gammaproteobacteria bacterium]
MPFIPHSEIDLKQMLDTVGVASVDDLFDEIPDNLRAKGLDNVPKALSEMELGRLMNERAKQDEGNLCFIGAGAYEHHIPAAVWDIAMRGEFLTAYTPYQAEASQGTLQVIYEFQTNIVNLTGLFAANASLYDGASGVAEAVLMAVRANRKAKTRRVLIAGTVHPRYRQTTKSIVQSQNIEMIEIPYDSETGVIDMDILSQYEDDTYAAVIIQQPDFFGNLEQVDALTDWAHAHNSLLIAVVNPLSLAIYSAPSEWGEKGADIAVGDGQPLGVPLSSGGPYYGFMACTKPLIRQMPGRIIGKTVDLDGKPGYTLTLQAREQHIRRAKATSNICTNQGLAVTASTIHMALLGTEGLERVAAASLGNTEKLVQKLTSIEGVELVFTGPRFHEAVLRLNKPVDEVLAALAEQNILGGLSLKRQYPELGEAMLVCATEMRSHDDIEQYFQVLSHILSSEPQS